MFKKNKNKGQVMLFVVFFLLLITLVIFSGFIFLVTNNLKLSFNLINSKKSYFLAESSAEDILYRAHTGKNYLSEENFSIDNFFATSTISDVAGDIEIISYANTSGNVRKTKILLSGGDGASFHYGLQVGNGGLEMDKNSAVTGNVYSNGPVIAGDNEIYGDVVSAGATGLIDGIHATGSVYAHDIVNSEIDIDAYYQSISGSTVGGTLYPGSSDLPAVDFPIADDLIEEWKSSASTTVISAPCPYVIDSDIEIGSVKINCDLEISSDPIVTLTGPIWVNGDIVFENNAIIKVKPSLGKKSIAIIADKTTDQQNGGTITLKNNVVFEGSGTNGSYVLVVSQNSSSENGGAVKAIDIYNNAEGDLLLYASHGEILLKNNTTLREVTAYKITLTNLANILYESGLASLIFQSGPGGSLSVNVWEEIE